MFFIMKRNATIFCLLPAAWPFINPRPLQLHCTSLTHIDTNAVMERPPNVIPNCELSPSSRHVFFKLYIKGAGQSTPLKEFCLVFDSRDERRAAAKAILCAEKKRLLKALTPTKKRKWRRRGQN